MYNGLQHAHSGWRWIVLLTLLWAIIWAINNWSSAKISISKVPLWALITSHIQLLLGLVLLFISPRVQFAGEAMKDAVYRFYTVEHTVGMVLAVILITVGYVRSKKKTTTAAQARSVFWFYLIGLLIMLISIPWPFRNLGGSWF